jgi:hypothetical protein
VGCYNNDQHEEARSRAIEQTLERDSQAFFRATSAAASGLLFLRNLFYPSLSDPVFLPFPFSLGSGHHGVETAKGLPLSQIRMSQKVL